MNDKKVFRKSFCLHCGKAGLTELTAEEAAKEPAGVDLPGWCLNRPECVLARRRFDRALERIRMGLTP